MFTIVSITLFINIYFIVYDINNETKSFIPNFIRSGILFGLFGTYFKEVILKCSLQHFYWQGKPSKKG